MKKIILLLFLLGLVSSCSLGQGFNEDKTSLANFLKRMYNSSPFEGVKVVQDYDNNYLISVVSLEKAKYSSNSILIRVAQTKAQSQANTFFNGSYIASDLVIKTTELKQKDSTIVQTIESIRENSIGFVKGLELLTNFEIEDGQRMLFIYYKELKQERTDQ
jgi:hypothetical protein